MLLCAAGLVLGKSPESRLLKRPRRSLNPLVTLAILRSPEQSQSLCYPERVGDAEAQMGLQSLRAGPFVQLFCLLLPFNSWYSVQTKRNPEGWLVDKMFH